MKVIISSLEFFLYAIIFDTTGLLSGHESKKVAKLPCKILFSILWTQFCFKLS